MIPLLRSLLAAITAVPVAIALVPVLLSSTLVARLRRLRANSSPPIPSSRDCCSIIILNWNGRPLLAEHLPSVLEAVERDGQPHQILVVDNGSTDGSPQWLRTHFPTVDILELPSNRGFGQGNNAGVAAAHYETVVLLNNDMRVEPDFLRPLLQALTGDVFAAASQIFFQETSRRREESGKTFARWRGWRLELGHGPIEAGDVARGTSSVFWAGGGASAYDRAKFLALGGFDPLYWPAYAEDTDLSFRAWKRGWPSVLAAASVVHHRHRSTSAKLFDSQQQLNLLLERHLILFGWACLESPRYLLPFLLDLPARLAAVALRGPGAGRLLFGLLRSLGAVVARRTARPRPVLSERRIFARANSLLEYLCAYVPVASRHAERLNLLFVCAYVPCLWRHGGAGRVFNLIQRLAKRHRVTLITFLENEDDHQFLPELESFCHKVIAVPRRARFRFEWFAYEPFAEFDQFEMHDAVRQAVEEQDFDVAHLEYTQMGVYSRWCRRSITFLSEIEVNYAAARTRHRYTSGWWQRIKSRYDWMQTFNRELALCRLVDHVVCVNETDADYLRGYLDARKIHVIETGVDTNYFRPGQNGIEDPYRILFVGAYRHDPNIDAMLYFCRDIFPEIRRQDPEAQMWIVGSSPPPAIVNLGKLPGVRVAGFVENLADAYQRCAVMVVPLRTGVGIRGKILEAWASGRPVVATPLAAAGLDALHGENIIIAEDPGAFASWTVALLRNATARRRLGLQARQTAEQQYDWEALTARLERLYREAQPE